MSRNWYVVHTHEYCEKIASLNLEKQNYPVFLPLVTEIRQHPRFAHRPHQVQTSLFREYFFTEIDLVADTWHKICSTRGVKRLLGSSPESPTPVPAGGVEELMVRVAAGEFEPQATIRPVFGVGDKARFTSGHLQGEEGICRRIQGERMLLELLSGRRVNVRSGLLTAA